ncbi:carboxymuconolactone decarboxylase family protein [Pseudohaliea rubra]|uniref:4-carboxymuconolactone decarboxylase domain protein n=1 Tax=Pseudohaliea rubra DSM 19751 TaxID=1265313 RepID=A0A095XVR2_9GAMM|nr:carboxymuconolactone decarboxylase family protein [Pseudohaliea rubra]KGE03786.1 4-carboxymuconolactone decarboxylase domain protein [Pseudohaliea rubra DSM 19751]
MSRLSKLPPEQWDPELRTMTQADSASPIEQGITRMLAQAPAMAKAAVGFGAGVTLNRTLPERLIELLRLRVAFHNQCRSCMAIRYNRAADAVDEGLVCSLETPEEAPDLSPAEKVALAFADRFATDHLSITDERFDALREHFSEAEIVELMVHCALYVGMGRLAAVLDMTEELPEGYRKPFGETVTPWADAPIAVR